MSRAVAAYREGLRAIRNKAKRATTEEIIEWRTKYIETQCTGKPEEGEILNIIDHELCTRRMEKPKAGVVV